MKQRLVTLLLLLAILLLAIELVQRYSALHIPARQIAFSCIVAVQNEMGEVCIDGDPGGQVSVTINYCNHEHVTSPVIADQTTGTHEYRWLWQVHQPTSCRGQTANAQVWAFWADGSRASAKGVFYVASIAFERRGRQNHPPDKRIGHLL